MRKYFKMNKTEDKIANFGMQQKQCPQANL